MLCIERTWLVYEININISSNCFLLNDKDSWSLQYKKINVNTPCMHVGRGSVWLSKATEAFI